MHRWIRILKLRTGLFVFVTLLRLNFTSCSKVTYSHLKWQAASTATDGKPDEWKLPLKFYDQESKLNYDISNDKTNLYVIFKITDEFTKAKALRSGIQFAIDVNGKKAFPVTINYTFPLEHTLPLPGEMVNNPETQEEVRMQERLHFSQIMLNLSGFKAPVKEGLLSLKNEYGIHGAFDIDKNDILYYELKIPFATFYKETITAEDTLAPFNFQITLQAMQPPDRSSAFLKDDQTADPQSSGAGNFPGGSQGSMPGGSSGTMPGSGSPRPPMNEEPQNSKQTITQKLKLIIK